MSNAFAIRDRTEQDAGRPAARWIRPLLIAITALCGAALLVRFVAEPVMSVRHVIVQSDVALDDGQVLALSGLQGTERWYAVTATAVQKRLEANPLVHRASVEKIFPDTVRLTVWGREAAALVLATSGGRSLPVLVDGEGVVFKVGATSADVDLPVVAGIAAGTMALGAQLPQAYRALFASLAAMREGSPSLFALVSEVRISSAVEPSATSLQDCDIILYLTTSTIPVRLRGTVDGTQVKYALMVLDLLSRQGVMKDIQELDFRGGDVVYRYAPQGAASARALSANAAQGAAAEKAAQSAAADKTAQGAADGSKGGY
jgi:cell division protein FtsQ